MTPMPKDAERLQTLREFGVSEYGARCYLALLQLGSSEARAVQTAARVPPAKVHQVLRRLQEQGLVDIEPSTPRRFTPTPFNKFLQTVQKQHETRMAELERRSDELTELFPITGNIDARQPGRVELLHGRSRILERTMQLAREAERDFIVLAADGFAERADHYANMLTGLASRGVTVRVFTPDPDDKQVRLLDSLVQVRTRTAHGDAPGRHAAIGVIDGKHAFLVHYTPDDGDARQGDDQGIVILDSPIADALLAIINDSWNQAPQPKKKR